MDSICDNQLDCSDLLSSITGLSLLWALSCLFLHVCETVTERTCWALVVLANVCAGGFV